MRQDDQREVTVALNADTSKYTKGLKEANAETTKLSKAVSVLSEKTDGLVKNSSKKLILFGTGQLAALSGMSTIAATLEKQMADINTQASIVGKSMDADKIKDNIKSLSTQIPLARHEIVAMSNAITNMGVTSTRQINDLTKSFLQLGAATGEPAAAVGAGMIQLQRQMGTFSQNTQVTSNMNDSLTALSLQGGTPAADILGFSGQIAPSARVAGMSQQSVMGISTAFTRAGEDGRYAVSMLNSLNNDLTMMKATNSPELTRYAHTLGVSVNDLKEMSPEQIFSQLLSTVQTQGGAQGLQTLSLLGLGDNPRAVKAIQAVANAGGIDKWIGVSNEKYGSGETEKAAGESWSGFFDSLTVLRNQFTQLGQQLGETILPILTKMASAASSFLEAIKPLTDMIMTVVGTLSGGIGTALIGAGVAGRLWAAASTPSIIKRGISGTSVQAFRYGKMRGSREALSRLPIETLSRSIVR
jgi:TP901 family phage tail tape measure protein